MSRYRRNYGGPVTVSLHWSSMIGAYELKFDNAYNQWDKVQAIIAWIKMTIPAGLERDYDDTTYTWTIHEKHFKALKDVLSTVSEFQLNIVEKPEGGGFGQVKFIPLKEYTDLFKFVTGEDVNDLEFARAQKIYRIAAMKMHPDRNPNDSTAGAKMSEFNEAWDIIKERHYKIVRVVEQIQ